jgi:hypothetical protein
MSFSSDRVVQATSAFVIPTFTTDNRSLGFKNRFRIDRDEDLVAGRRRHPVRRPALPTPNLRR